MQIYRLDFQVVAVIRFASLNFLYFGSHVVFPFSASEAEHVHWNLLSNYHADRGSM